MPLSSDDLRHMHENAKGGAARAVVIDVDRACIQCGYNLRGLKPDGRCPECGRPIGKKRRGPVFADQMSAAPLVWTKGFVHGTFALAMGISIIIPCAIVSMMEVEGSRGVTVMVIGGLFWFVGALLATRPRPVTDATTMAPTKEWVWERFLGRWSQAAWVIGPALVAASAQVSVGERALFALGIAFIAAAIIGIAPLLLVLSNLTYWAADTNLAYRLKIASWTLPLSGLILQAMVIGGFEFWFGSIVGGLAVLIVGFGVLILPLGHAWLTMLQTWRMACWVAINHVTADQREARAREKFERERRRAEQMRSTGNPPGQR